jgi:hypothetical protein
MNRREVYIINTRLFSNTTTDKCGIYVIDRCKKRKGNLPGGRTRIRIATSNKIHRGPSYYLWKVTCILKEDPDKGFLLMNKALEEDKL